MTSWVSFAVRYSIISLACICKGLVLISHTHAHAHAKDLQRPYFINHRYSLICYLHVINKASVALIVPGNFGAIVLKESNVPMMLVF